MNSKKPRTTAGAVLPAPPPTQRAKPPEKQRISTVDGFIAAAQSKATKRAYANDVQHYLQHGGAIPSTGAMVADYLAKFAATLKVATLERRCIAIHNAHTGQGLPSPVKGNELVKATMNGIRRTMGTRQRAVKPVTKDVLLEMLVTLDKKKKM